MAKVVGIEEFVAAIYQAIWPKLRRSLARAGECSVKSVSGGTAQVVPDGEADAVPARLACDASAGDRAVIIRQGTNLYVIGVLK